MAEWPDFSLLQGRLEPETTHGSTASQQPQHRQQGPGALPLDLNLVNKRLSKRSRARKSRLDTYFAGLIEFEEPYTAPDDSDRSRSSSPPTSFHQSRNHTPATPAFRSAAVTRFHRASFDKYSRSKWQDHESGWYQGHGSRRGITSTHAKTKRKYSEGDSDSSDSPSPPTKRIRRTPIGRSKDRSPAYFSPYTQLYSRERNTPDSGGPSFQHGRMISRRKITTRKTAKDDSGVSSLRRTRNSPGVSKMSTKARQQRMLTPSTHHLEGEYLTGGHSLRPRSSLHRAITSSFGSSSG